MKTRNLLMLALLLTFCSASMMLSAQSETPVLLGTLQNLSQPNSEPVVLGKGTHIEAHATDELEITWRLNADSPVANQFKDVKGIRCTRADFLAQLKLGSPDSLAQMSLVDDPTCVKVRFKASDFASLLDAHKPGMKSFPTQTKVYVKFGDFVLQRQSGEVEPLVVTARQHYVGLMLN